MNIKSLLLGSAAAFAVVSGAHAADAVVAAEPEPVEYVKVCDAYGTGFFYIPGTETCLKIGGQLRYEVQVYKVGHNRTYLNTHSRFKLDVEAKNDSEWGTVYSWIRVQGDQNNNYGAGNPLRPAYDNYGGPNKGLNWYYIFGIGGLEFGNFDSQWAKFFGYGGFTDDGGVYDNDWDIDSRQYVSYTADFGSVKAYISLDNDADEFFAAGGDAFTGGEGHHGHKYLPDVTAGASGTFGDWQVAGGVAYDESDKSVALKGLVAGNFGIFGVRFMPLWSNSDTNIYDPYDGFSALFGFQVKATDSITLSLDPQIWDNGDFRVVGDVNWEVASGFSVLLEGIYADRENAAGDSVKTKSGMLRFQRSF